MNNIEPAVLHSGHVWNSWIKRLFVVFLTGALITLIYQILVPFLSPIAWALVLSHVTWPLYLRLKSAIGNWPALCALIMVVGTVILILVPLLWFVLIIQNSAVDSYHALGVYLSSEKNVLPDAVLAIPWLGQELQNWTTTHLGNTAALNQQLTLWTKQGSAQLVDFFGHVGRNVAKAVFTSVTLFVLYRDGENMLRITRAGLCKLLGERVHGYVQTAGETIRAVMFWRRFDSCYAGNHCRGGLSAIWSFQSPSGRCIDGDFFTCSHRRNIPYLGASQPLAAAQ